MKKILIFLAMVLMFSSGVMALKSCTFFKGGDANNDGKVDISDVIFILQYLFQGGREPNCFEVVDTNRDSIVDISDGIFLLSYLFSGGPVPISNIPKCNEGAVSQTCICGSKEVISGYCCFGKSQEKSCQYIPFENIGKTENNIDKKKIFLCSINNPTDCEPTSLEYQLTDSSFEDGEPDVAHVRYKYDGDVIVLGFPDKEAIIWQRYEGIEKVYACIVSGKEAKECEKTKSLLSSGFNPSIEFTDLFGLDRATVGKEMHDLIAIWETDSEIMGCTIEVNLLYDNPIRLCQEQIISKKSAKGYANPMLKEKDLIWINQLDENSEVEEMKACNIEKSYESRDLIKYPIGCFSSEIIDAGDIDPETGDVLRDNDGNRFIAYSKRIDPSLQEQAIYLNGVAISFPNIPTLESVTLYNPIELFLQDGEVFLAFKDINYINPGKDSVIDENFLPSGHTIWILGGEAGKIKNLISNLYSGSYPYPNLGFKSTTISEMSRAGLKLYRVNSNYHISIHGDNVICNSEQCYIWDKQIGANSNSLQSRTGKFTEFNNFQNDLLVCPLSGIGALSAGGTIECGGKGLVERVL